MKQQYDFLTSKEDICGRLRIRDDVFRTLLALGMPVRKFNGRFYAHFHVLDQWLRWKLNPYAANEPVEVNVADATPPDFDAGWPLDGVGR